MKPHKFEQLAGVLQLILDKIDAIETLLGNPGAIAPKEEELLTIEQVSKLLNLSVSTLYSKVCRNEIPVNKVGKRLYFYRYEIMQWISSGRIKTSIEILKEVDTRFKKKHVTTPNQK